MAGKSCWLLYFKGLRQVSLSTAFYGCRLRLFGNEPSVGSTLESTWLDLAYIRVLWYGGIPGLCLGLTIYETIAGTKTPKRAFSYACIAARTSATMRESRSLMIGGASV